MEANQDFKRSKKSFDLALGANNDENAKAYLKMSLKAMEKVSRNAGFSNYSEGMPFFRCSSQYFLL